MQEVILIQILGMESMQDRIPIIIIRNPIALLQTGLPLTIDQASMEGFIVHRTTINPQGVTLRRHTAIILQEVAVVQGVVVEVEAEAAV